MEGENEESVMFQQSDLFSLGFPIMEEIRRQGKLCDVTLKVCCVVSQNSSLFRIHELLCVKLRTRI
jgi:hypothetical protein